MGSIEAYNGNLKLIITGNPSIEILGEGYEWSEGPVWVESERMLLFSDVPRNTVYKWTSTAGVIPYLNPSGYTGGKERAGEVGANGLALSPDGSLILAQHGDRRIAKMESPITMGFPHFSTIADRYQKKRLSSPNDLFITSDGIIYFTDPPYGLPQQDKDPLKEIPFQGVFKIDTSGMVTLMTDSLTRPNGIAITPDGKQAVVANSDPKKAAWYIYDINELGNFTNGRVFHDATDSLQHAQGLPDGLAIDKNGIIFASGPGGIWIMNLEGKLLGKIKINALVSNCALSGDEKTLFITADSYLLKVKLKN